MIASDTVMFAIQGGLQLYGAMRKAYVDGTRGRALVLPLPRSEGVDWSSARTWFKMGDGKAVVKQYPRVGELLALDEPDAGEKAELTELYRAVRSVVLPGEEASDGSRGLISGEELSSLVTVRQWTDGKYGPEPTALQQIAGTVVNIAIDYFQQAPGAISDKRPEGRALRAFLNALDSTDFATAAVTDIAPDLFIAVLDSVAANPDLVAGGDKEQLLVKNVVEAFARSSQELLADASATERADAAVWVQLAARAVISGGAETILANPKRFLGVTDPGADLVSRVGRVMVDLVLGEERCEFQKLLSGEGLNQVAKAVLEAVADNPDLLKIGDKGVKNILLAVARDVSKMPAVFSPDVFPELASSILQRSAENMDLIWGKRFNRPDRHLLVTASRTLLQELAKVQGPGSTWKLSFTKDQLLSLTDSVFDEVVENPEWLIQRAGERGSNLKVAVEAAVAALRKVDGNRVSVDTGVLVLRAAIEAVARRISFLDELPAEGEVAARRALTAALDAIFETIFGDGVDADARWGMARNSSVLAIVEIGLEELAEVGATVAHIDKLREAIQNCLADGGCFHIDAFADDLRQRLAQVA